MMKTKKLLILAAGLMASKLFAFEPVATDQLLLSYLENDSQLKKLTLDAQKAELSLKSTELSNGFNVTLSTGNIVIKTTNDGSNISVKNSSVSASLPQANNLTASVSSEMSITNGDFSKANAMKDTKINLSIDLISGNQTSRKVALMKAERSLLEAKRKVTKQAITAETTFYKDLKSLLTATSDILNAESSLYTDTMSFESTKAKGYTKTSSTYRLAEMKVISDQHTIDSKTRDLLHSYTVFYKNCGYDIELDENTNFFDLLPLDIPQVTVYEITDFKEEEYSEIESANWTHTINSLNRKANKTFTLTANGGYTINNSNTSSNSADAGLSSKIGGLSLSAGVSIPVDSSKDSKPAYTLSASLNPVTFFQNKITKETNEITEEQELLDIESAYSKYETSVVETKQSLADLDWTKKTYQESYDMYLTLSKELKNWYSQGLINESEYRSAETNTLSYKVKLLTNAIDYIIYNNNLRSLFVED